MSLLVDRPTAASTPPARPAAISRPDVPPAAEAPPRRLAAVPEGTEARGFALYVGLDEFAALDAGTDLASVVDEVKVLLARIAPAATTHAAVALAPIGAGGRDVDVVRLALHEPRAVAAQRRPEQTAEPKTRGGVVVDVSRKRVLIDGEQAPLTYKEFELLQYLVLREGRTIDRAEIVAALWSAEDDEVPNERTIDVHVRRLRAKLGDFEDIVRTVRGLGYRFDRHADVAIRQATTPSPDFF